MGNTRLAKHNNPLKQSWSVDQPAPYVGRTVISLS